MFNQTFQDVLEKEASETIMTTETTVKDSTEVSIVIVNIQIDFHVFKLIKI